MTLKDRNLKTATQGLTITTKEKESVTFHQFMRNKSKSYKIVLFKDYINKMINPRIICEPYMKL